MKATLRSVRIAPKKANLIAKMVRGKSVPEAVASLERTNKKAARLLEDLIRSAMANASHNEQQKPEDMVIKTLTVNKAQAYYRGIPMARGRQRIIRKFLSHITVQLGYPEDEMSPESGAEKKEGEKEKQDAKSAKKPTQSASQPAKKTVQKGQSSASKAKKTPAKKSATKKTASSKASSAKKEGSASSSSASRS